MNKTLEQQEGQPAQVGLLAVYSPNLRNVYTIGALSLACPLFEWLACWLFRAG